MILATHAQGWMLRSYALADAQYFSQYASNPLVAANMRDAFPHPFSLTAAENWLKKAVERQPETFFAIATEEGLIGSIGFAIQEDVYRLSAEIAYWLAEPYWGRGVTTWAVQTVTAYAFERCNLMRLYAGVFASNPASARVLEKSGYTFEGRLRKSVIKHERIMDQYLYAIVRSEDGDRV